MPDFTTRLGMYLPGGGADGTITPDETADIDKLNDNFRAIDTAIGSSIVTSTTRPATPYQGQLIYETDTGRTMVREGSTWRPVAGVGQFKVANDAERAALTGMRKGDLCYQSDTDSEYRYDGSVWRDITPSMRYFEGTQSLGNNSATDLQSSGSRGGFGNAITDGTNALVIAKTGWYRIDASIGFATNATGSRILEITGNGSDLTRRLASRTVADGATALTVSGIRFFGSGTVVRARGFQNSGAALTVAHTLALEFLRNTDSPV